MGNLLRVPVVAPVIVLCLAATAAADIVDGFEASTLGSHWTRQRAWAGAISLTTESVHSGSQALKFQSFQGAGPKELQLYADFSPAAWGKASVWMREPGGGASSSNYLYMNAETPSLLKSISIGGVDYRNEFIYAVSPDPIVFTSYTRDSDWHLLSFTNAPGFVQVQLDDNILYTGTNSFPMDWVVLTMSGPTWRPAWTLYMDDFSFQVIPEPATTVLFGVGLGIVLLRVTRRRRLNSGA